MTLIVCKMLSWPFGITQNPDHDLCPPGEESWCGFQRDISKGTADYVHKSPIPEAVADAIYPTFEALSDEKFTFSMPSWWNPKSKRGHQWAHLATGNQGNTCQYTNCRAGNLPSSWPLQ